MMEDQKRNFKKQRLTNPRAAKYILTPMITKANNQVTIFTTLFGIKKFKLECLFQTIYISELQTILIYRT